LSSIVASTPKKLLKKSTISVAIQGELGAYSQQAVYSFFGKEAANQIYPLPTLQRVFSALFEKGESAPDFAVVPIENSTAGSVGETIDLLISKDVRIIGETSVPVEHCLIIHKNTSLDKIRKVMSHPQALAQCKEYLDREGNRWEQVPVYDTAGSVKMIKEQSLMDTAGIASELASEIYGMALAAKGIEDDPSNRTRFVVVEKAERDSNTVNEPTGNDKTSVVFATKHEPGCLVRALSALSSRAINVDRIESRPIRGKSWEYYFYVDFAGHVKDENCRKALEDLKYQTEELKVLGSYPRGV
jgi:chorismate mutase / prephenate dehydratase